MLLPVGLLQDPKFSGRTLKPPHFLVWVGYPDLSGDSKKKLYTTDHRRVSIHDTTLAQCEGIRKYCVPYLCRSTTWIGLAAARFDIPNSQTPVCALTGRSMRWCTLTVEGVPFTVIQYIKLITQAQSFFLFFIIWRSNCQLVTSKRN